MLNIVVPMAGSGSRFAGTPEPKPLIEVVPGRRMIEYVIDYLAVPEPHRFIFVCLAAHVRPFDLERFFAARTRNHKLIQTETVTAGPAATALLAHSLIDDRSELLIAYADCHIDFDTTDFLGFARGAGADGAVVTYPSYGKMESYVEIDPAGRVRRAAEKERISTTASGSLYYFRTGRDFVAAARRMIATDRVSGRETFVCPVLNDLIAEGKLVMAYPITREQRIEMGTPEDLDRSRRWLVNRQPTPADA